MNIVRAARLQTRPYSLITPLLIRDQHRLKPRSNIPFYGRGLASPIRIDPVTGGFRVNAGNNSAASIAIEYFLDRPTIREDIDRTENHVADGIGNIIFTSQLEHDTLPEFGSRTNNILFDLNHPSVAFEFEAWLEESTKRWEHRASIPMPDGVQWNPTADGIDRGELPVTVRPQFLHSQQPQNLVSPFVTEKQARLAEYPSVRVDAGGHDLTSRYRNHTVYTDTVRYIRPRRFRPTPPQSDDQFYETVYGDTWLLVAYKNYGDQRYWWVAADYYTYDCASEGIPRDSMNPNIDPPINELLRLPSKSRLLMELV